MLNDNKIVISGTQEMLRTILYEGEAMMHEAVSVLVRGERKLD